MAAKKTYTMQLNRLYCYMVEEHDYDDVYLKMDGNKIWPTNRKNQPMHMDTSSSLQVTIPGIEDGQKIVIELWDWDFLSRDDLLGTFTMLIEETGGPFTTDMIQNTKETNTAKYTLEWEIY